MSKHLSGIYSKRRKTKSLDADITDEEMVKFNIYCRFNGLTSRAFITRVIRRYIEMNEKFLADVRKEMQDFDFIGESIKSPSQY